MSGEIGLKEAVSIGIGGMVGGGIFAVLGLAVELAGGGTPVAFAIAGLVAILTSYSYAQLSVAFPSQGGTVTFLVRGFGSNIFSGSLNVLLWISYIIMLSLYAYAFGSYGATFFPAGHQLLMKHVLISGVIIAITALNAMKAAMIGKAEDVIVGVKVAILLIFVGVGLITMRTASFSLSAWPGALTLVSGGFIIFVAYEGFELIANTAQDIKNPERNLPLAYLCSVLFVVGLYVLIAMVALGNLSVEQIVNARDYALAEAASPFMGSVGFILITVAALLSTTSAINATLYGTARLSYIIAKVGELPEFLEYKIWNKPLEGLLITTGVTLITANLLNLRNISTIGSAGFLIIFGMVNLANVRLRESTGSRWYISEFGAICCALALCFLVYETLQSAPESILILAAVLILSVTVELAYQRYRKKCILHSAVNSGGQGLG